MQLNEYQSLANRTARSFGDKQKDVLHAVLGMSSEAGELSETMNKAAMRMPFDAGNITEEIGDGSWYVAWLCTVMGWELEELILDPATASDMSEMLAASVLTRNPIAIAMSLNAFAGEMSSISKANFVYGKDLDVDLLKRNAQLYFTTLSILSDIHGLDFLQVTLPVNIDKLKKRYPDGYSDLAAIERADKVQA